MEEASSLYRRSLAIVSEFPDAVAGLATTLSAICDWRGRGNLPNNLYMDDSGRLLLKNSPQYERSVFLDGWMDSLVKLCDHQTREAYQHAVGVIAGDVSLDNWLERFETARGASMSVSLRRGCIHILRPFFEDLENGGNRRQNEASFIIRFVELNTRMIQRRWFFDTFGVQIQSTHVLPSLHPVADNSASTKYARPSIPLSLSIPPAISVPPFHTVSLLGKLYRFMAISLMF